MKGEQNPLIKIKDTIIAARSIIDEVIPELQDIAVIPELEDQAEHSRNELRKAMLILKEGLDAFKDPSTGQSIIIHILLHEQGEITHEPFITLDYESALIQYQQLLVQQGFREMRMKEGFHAYRHEYQELLEGY